MKMSNYLMPKEFRSLGIVFFMIGLVLLVLRYQFNYKPDFLSFKVFAFYSFYIEAKTFSVITHQMIEEFAGFFILTGLFFIAFAKEKVEFEWLDSLRLKSFIVSAYMNLLYLLMSVFFFFGFGFVGALTVYMVFGLVVYIVVFRFQLYRTRSTR